MVAAIHLTAVSYNLNLEIEKSVLWFCHCKCNLVTFPLKAFVKGMKRIMFTDSNNAISEFWDLFYSLRSLVAGVCQVCLFMLIAQCLKQCQQLAYFSKEEILSRFILVSLISAKLIHYNNSNVLTQI